MYKTTIRKKIIFSFLLIVLLTNCIFIFYVLRLFNSYSQDALIKLVSFHLRQCERVIYNNWTDRSNLNQLASLIYPMGSREYGLKTEVIDTNGQIIAAYLGEVATYNQSACPEVKAALTGELSHSIREDGTFSTLESPELQETFFVAMPLRTQGTQQLIIRTASSGIVLQDAIGKLAHHFFLGLLLFLILTILISFKLAQKILSPLEQITTAATNISQGAIDAKVDYKSDDEFGILAHTLNNLTARLSTKIKELSKEKQKQDLILEQMDNIVMLVDKSGAITSINHRGRYVFHHHRNTCAIGKHNYDIIGSTVLSRTIQECFEENKSKAIELQLTRSGLKYTFQVFINPLLSLNENSTQSVLLVFHDITALLNMYERQIEFIANASHELSTPLTSIRGYSETLLDGALDSPELRQKFVEVIFEESEHMQKLVQDLLQLTKLDSNEYRKTIAFSEVSTQGIFEKISQRLAQQISQKALTLEIIYEKQPQDILANADWFTQALLNLLENAIKYSPLQGKIRLIYDHDQFFASFSIQDEGPGIAEENMPFIFDRFYRTDRARARDKTTGAGIGLSIVKFVVELFGGEVKVESQVNIGSTFTLYIPLAKEEN